LQAASASLIACSSWLHALLSHRSAKATRLLLALHGYFLELAKDPLTTTPKAQKEQRVEVKSALQISLLDCLNSLFLETNHF
jgi:hypothetical protein